MGAGLSSLANIRTALVSQIEQTLTAVDDSITVVSGRHLNPTPPCIDVYQAPTSRGSDTTAFGDLAGSYLFTVRARVPSLDNVAGQDTLLRFQDDEDVLSVPQAILDDPTLGGYAFDTHLPDDGFSGDILYVEAGTEFLGCQWLVQVIGAES